MKMSFGFRSISVLVLPLALLAAASSALAQACVGLPSGRGLLAVGFEGTDGATGEGLTFAYQAPRVSVLLQRRSLDGFTLVDDLRTSEVQVSTPLPALPVCLVAGARWTAYDNDRHEGQSWSAADPRYRTERYRMGGPYRRMRVPVGVGLGREFRLGEGVSLVPFIQPALVWEHERYAPEQDGPEQTRSAWGLGGSGGVTAAFGWLVVRTAVTHAATHDRALSSQNNWPELSAQVGVRF